MNLCKRTRFKQSESDIVTIISGTGSAMDYSCSFYSTQSMLLGSGYAAHHQLALSSAENFSVSAIFYCCQFSGP